MAATLPFFYFWGISGLLVETATQQLSSLESILAKVYQNKGL